MCGIATILSFREGAGLGGIKAMTSVIRHRGPDDEGYLFVTRDGQAHPKGGADTPDNAYHADLLYSPRSRFEGDVPEGAQVAFGHRRLSIVDLSPAGHQPMCTQDGRYWITYNGEIYNYVELRRELEGLGHHFLSRSDTEVILAAYSRWGVECQHRFNGMWAFVILDLASRRVFAARDRFGVKPFYYWVSPEGFLAFASEIKQFTVLPGWSPRLNGQRVYDFLNWALQDHTSETLFDDVFQLRGGEAVEIDLDRFSGLVSPFQWYQLRPKPFSASMPQAAAEFRELLTDAVRLRLRADVPLGSCLSGGLDSSSIVCLVNDLLHDAGVSIRQKSFSACSLEHRFDERPFIEQVVHARNIESHYTYPSLETLFETLDNLTWHQDEPFGSTSIYAQWHVFKLAADHKVKVMLDGQGADEQLAGYHTFFAPHYAELFRKLRWIRLLRETWAASEVHGYASIVVAKQMASALLPDPLINFLKKSLGADADNPDWLDLEALGAVPRNPHRGTAATIRQFSLAQLTATNLPMLLHWEDRDSMAHSIESRVPFLDYRLVEFVLGLPDDFKLHNGITKRVMREGMAGIIPDSIRTRMDKKGFMTSEEVWLRTQQPDAFRRALQRAIEASGGIIRPNACERLEAIIEGREPFQFLPWRLISFGSWVERFGVKASREDRCQSISKLG